MVEPWQIDLEVYGDEAELVDGLRRHDRHACTCLLKRYGGRLYRLALRLTAGREEAEEVLQEGLIQACAHIDQFEGRSSLGTWLRRIVVNAALMRLRRKSPTLVSLPMAEGDAGDEAELGTDPMDLNEGLVSEELWLAVEGAMLELPDGLRAAFVLRDIEGLTPDEAAQVLGITRSALNVRLHRARVALRATLTPHLRDEGGIA